MKLVFLNCSNETRARKVFCAPWSLLPCWAACFLEWPGSALHPHVGLDPLLLFLLFAPIFLSFDSIPNSRRRVSLWASHTHQKLGRHIVGHLFLPPSVFGVHGDNLAPSFFVNIVRGLWFCSLVALHVFIWGFGEIDKCYCWHHRFPESTPAIMYLYTCA